MRKILWTGLAAITLAAVTASPAAALNPRYLQGMNTAAAGNTLKYEGYQRTRNTNAYGLRWGLWYSRGARASCIGVTARDGYITEARRFDDADCLGPEDTSDDYAPRRY
jgi:hypothetical protein